jgi:hypothetical protein
MLGGGRNPGTETLSQPYTSLCCIKPSLCDAAFSLTAMGVSTISVTEMAPWQTGFAFDTVQ